MRAQHPQCCCCRGRSPHLEQLESCSVLDRRWSQVLNKKYCSTRGVKHPKKQGKSKSAASKHQPWAAFDMWGRKYCGEKLWMKSEQPTPDSLVSNFSFDTCFASSSRTNRHCYPIWANLTKTGIFLQMLKLQKRNKSEYTPVIISVFYDHPNRNWTTVRFMNGNSVNLNF